MANWDEISSRGKVQDRRGLAPVIGTISLTGLALYFGINLLLGNDLGSILSGLDGVTVQQTQNIDTNEFAGEDEYELFASTVLGSNNQYWQAIFQDNSNSYLEPTLVLFRTATESGCGTATSQVGPHYCPLDQTIYLDETFFEELINRFGANGGDVAEAYVISHEVGHHIQTLLGITDKVHQAQLRNDPRANDLSINLELQADCFAGLWANSIKGQGVLEPGEIQEALDAAAAVGDDRIQESVNGQINPETWTHGSSQQRINWFTIGYETGDYNQCDTFSQ